MHDIRAIRANPDQFDAAMALRGLAPQSATILHADEARRAAQTQLQDLQAARNEASSSVAA